VTKSGLPNNRMACPYCGLESPVSTHHATALECIAALEREVNHLREYLLHGQLSVTTISEPVPNLYRDSGRSLRISLTR